MDSMSIKPSRRNRFPSLRMAGLAFAIMGAFLLVISEPRFAGAAGTREEFPVAELSVDQNSPRISGDIVVWEDRRNGVPDIFARNLATGREFGVAVAARSQQRPDIDGRMVVWEDDRGGNLDVYARDLGTKTTVRVAGGKSRQSRPSVSGKLVVWEQGAPGHRDIYAYNLGTGKHFAVVTGEGDQRNSAISGKTVVWEESDGEDSDIYGKNLATGRKFRVAGGGAWQDRPDIGGRWVVWRDDRSPGGYDVYGFDLHSKREFPVATGPGDQSAPAVGGRVAVWTDGRGGNPDIYGRDLSTREEFAVSTGPAPQHSPAVSDERVVWEAQRTGEVNFGTWDLYGARLDIAPASVLGLNGDGSLTGVSLGWKASPEGDLAGYSVYRAPAPGGPYEKLNPTLLSGPRYFDSLAPAGRPSFYRITALDAAGNESAFSAIRSAALAPTTVSMNVNRATVDYGDRTSFSGRLTSGGKGLAGKKLALTRRLASGEFVAVTEVTTRADGSFSVALKPERRTYYRVRFAGDTVNGFARATSDAEQVRVRAAISTNLSRSSLKKGERLVISGLVRPTHRGNVRLTIEGNGRVVARKSLELHSVESSQNLALKSSRYRFNYRPPEPGRYTVRASFAGDRDHLGATSAARGFTVTR